MFELYERKRGRINLVVIISVITVFAMMILGKMFSLQILNHDYYLDKVIDNIQKETVIKANRGNIYDRNSNLLATNLTVWRVFISPADVRGENERIVAEGLSEILGVDYDEIYQKILIKSGKGSKDQTIKKNVVKADADKVRDFISQNKLAECVFLEEGTMRYYPGGVLASQVIGVMGTDAGLFGLEFQYNKELSGTNGVYVSSKDALGNELPGEYEKYIDAKDGYNVITTIDTKVQSILENQLKLTYEENRAGNGVCGVVIDVNDGSVLGMATYPNFDLNSPYTLVGEYAEELKNSEHEEGSKEYQNEYTRLLQSMWSNKTIAYTYSPGSTFKPITTSMAFQENTLNEKDEFTCTGVKNVLGNMIHCHNRNGHETHYFPYMLQQSCNPTMMEVALELGTKMFLKYFVEYGYTEKTGIDLPGESVGSYFTEDNFGTVDLAVSSFGQGFTTTALRQITSICAIANGGHLITPHVVSGLTDASGNLVVSYDYSPKTQIVSADVAERITAILKEGVVSGGSKNAYVAGYRVAGKTGTSEKKGVINPETGKDDMVIGSCVAYAPAEKPEVAIIIMVDEPNPPVGTRYGGVVAAPYVANALEQILPYLGIEPEYDEEEMKSLNFTVGEYTGLTVDKAKKNITSAGADYEIIGEGSHIVAQVPASGEVMRKSDGKIILYTGELKYDDAGNIITDGIDIQYSTVPYVKDEYTYKAIAMLKEAGFNVKVSGAQNYNAGTYASVTNQSSTEGKLLPKGSIIEITSKHFDDVGD
ncbi:MAG: PASTA domain-containing protein [Ruminococcaceae bacterium]|nr:PASTA domain-containing protein [Oscillospiraceae bacterium]